MAEHPILIDLPDDMLREIARIAIQWAYLGHLINNLIRELIDLDAKQARIALSTGRMSSRLNIVYQLLVYKQIDPGEPYRGLRQRIQELEDDRNDIVHGLWVYDEANEKITLQVTSGNWNTGTKIKIARRITPQGMPMSAQELATIRTKIESLNSDFALYAANILATVASLQKKSLEQPQPETAPQPHTQTTRQDQPPPSQG